MNLTVLQATFLGIVQGLTELLPISSSAHLTVLPWLMWNVEDIGAFDVALHAGTLLAIALFFFKDWIALLKGAYRNVVKKEKTFEGKMFLYLVLATIPGGLIGFVLDDKLDLFLETKGILVSVSVIATALIVMGLLLYFIDKKAKSEVKYENMNLKQTFLIGFSQALAFIPGVSRSGVTMTTARAMGIERESAAKYSFMLSAPIVLAATMLKFLKGEFVFCVPFFAGVFASFIVGILVIKFLLKYLQKGDFKVFAIYRVLFGLIILAKVLFF